MFSRSSTRMRSLSHKVSDFMSMAVLPNRYRHRSVIKSSTSTSSKITNTTRPYYNCCHHLFPTPHHEEGNKPDNHHGERPGVPETDYGFEIKANNFKFGPGVLREVGMDVIRVLKDIKIEKPRIAIYTDKVVRNLESFEIMSKSVRTFVPQAQILIYGKAYIISFFFKSCIDSVEIEPTDKSFQDAIQFAKDHKPDIYISFGGGSVMDTAKAANLYA